MSLEVNINLELSNFQKQKEFLVRLKYFGFILICMFFFVFQRAEAMSHRFGAFWGNGTYANELGDIYKNQTDVFGFQYQANFSNAFGLNFQYDNVTLLDGILYLKDKQGNVLDAIKTQIKADMVAITPTYHFRYQENQPVVPRLGMGISYLHGIQKFNESETLKISEYDITGFGLDILYGLDIVFNPHFGLFLQGQTHLISAVIESGKRENELTTNRISEFCAGLFVTL